MHDVDRNSILFKDWEKKKQAGNHSHAAEDRHSHPNHDGHESQDHDHDHDHDHSHHHKAHHDHSADQHSEPPGPSHNHEAGGHSRHSPAAHDHGHDEMAYVDHQRDDHDHIHPDETRFSRDRVFTHLHGHKHVFYHTHHHAHDPAYQSLLHKIFKDPVRDWFAVALMALMILVGYYQWLPGHLSDGLLVCAAVIGIFPAAKNSLVKSLFRRRPTFELLVSLLLISGLFAGRFLETALISLFLLMGSFMRLDFSWKADEHA
jgi:cation transport ATPase